MDHSEALRLKAAARYVLGELTGSLREEYERHYMSCVWCADDLIACVEFVAGLRAVFRSEMNEKPATKSDTSIQ
jgi:hypothetical protein